MFEANPTTALIYLGAAGYTGNQMCALAYRHARGCTLHLFLAPFSA